MVQRLCIVCVIALLLLASGTSGHAGDEDIESVLDQAIAGEHRSDNNKARDQYRHPKETLLFFGLRLDMTVVEIWPGRGWYTEILAPVLRERGEFYAARFSLKDAPDFRKKLMQVTRLCSPRIPTFTARSSPLNLKRPISPQSLQRDRPTWF